MYVEDKNYKYVVTTSDNYVVLTDQRRVSGSWQEPETINTLTQYLKPSTIAIEGTQTFTNEREFTEMKVTNDYWERADSIEITTCGTILFIVLLIFMNGVTRVVKKGGAIFGN